MTVSPFGAIAGQMHVKNGRVILVVVECLRLKRPHIVVDVCLLDDYATPHVSIYIRYKYKTLNQTRFMLSYCSEVERLIDAIISCQSYNFVSPYCSIRSGERK